MLAELDHREPDSAAFIRPQRSQADIVMRFGAAAAGDTSEQPLSVELVLRPTIQHPPLAPILTDDVATAIHLEIIRDSGGTPVDCLLVDAHARAPESRLVQEAIWRGLADQRVLPRGLGAIAPGVQSEPLAVAQLLLLGHLVQEVYQL